MSSLTFKLWAWRLICLEGLAVCGALAADYVGTHAAYCGIRSGCDAVVFSDYGRIAGAPLPMVGLAAFGGFFALTFLQGAGARRLCGVLAILAAVAGAALMILQLVVLRAICPLCMVVDTTALGLGIIELAWPRMSAPTDDAAPRRLVSLATWIIAALACATAPLAWAAWRPAPTAPPQVRALQRGDEITLVEITDFSCEYCRKSHAAVVGFLKAHPEVTIARVAAPRPKAEHAEDAARAWLAAEEQHRGDAMAERLFAMEDFSPASCRSAAESVGLAMAEYDKSLARDEHAAEFAATLAWAEASGGTGLPQIWIGNQLLIGQQTEATLEAASARETRNRTRENDRR